MSHDMSFYAAIRKKLYLHHPCFMLSDSLILENTFLLLHYQIKKAELLEQSTRFSWKLSETIDKNRTFMKKI